LSVPDVVRNLNYTKTGDDIITVYWNSPVENYHPDIIYYNIYTNNTSHTSYTANYTLYNLTTGSILFISVSAVNGVGEGPNTTIYVTATISSMIITSYQLVPTYSSTSQVWPTPDYSSTTPSSTCLISASCGYTTSNITSQFPSPSDISRNNVSSSTIDTTLIIIIAVGWTLAVAVIIILIIIISIVIICIVKITKGKTQSSSKINQNHNKEIKKIHHDSIVAGCDNLELTYIKCDTMKCDTESMIDMGSPIYAEIHNHFSLVKEIDDTSFNPSTGQYYMLSGTDEPIPVPVDNPAYSVFNENHHKEPLAIKVYAEINDDFNSNIPEPPPVYTEVIEQPIVHTYSEVKKPPIKPPRSDEMMVELEFIDIPPPVNERPPL
jgi:hypothetical protein